MKMGRPRSCIDANGLKRGAWTAEEDEKLMAYVQKHGDGSWNSLPEKAGLQRCGKSCRLRWINYLRPDIKRGKFSSQEQNTIIQLHALLGNRWSAIASYLPRRTDNEIKNYWNTHIKKRLAMLGIDPSTHRPVAAPSGSVHSDSKKVSDLTHIAQWESARLEAEARLGKESSKQVQNNQPAGLQWRHHLPTQRVDELPRCLDILKAWKRLQLEAIVINDNNGDSSNDNTRSFRSSNLNDNNEGLFPKCMDVDQPWNMGTCSSTIDGDDYLRWIEGFSNLLFSGRESDDRNDDDDENYWDDLFDLV